MSRLIIVIMEDNDYPFGDCDSSHLEKKKVMVRKRVQFHPFQKKNMLLKAKKIKSFVNPFIIKLEQLLQQESSLHLLFEYVPIKIQTWISNINSEFIENFRNQLLELADYLAENSIVIDFKLKNIGMDQNYNPKYFIGLDYEINTLTGKDPLMEKYTAQINEIISPYRTKDIDQRKIKTTPEPNPQFPLEKVVDKIDESLKRENQRSVKQISLVKSQAVRTSGQQKYQTSQRDSIKKISNLGEYDMKLTFDGSQKVLFENLPKNISTNIKIQHIGKKINDLKNMIQNINPKVNDRKHDSLSLSPMKGISDERPNSSYQKGIGLQKQLVLTTAKPEKIEKPNHFHYGPQHEKMHTKELRQTQSESEYSRKLPNLKGLERANEKPLLNVKAETKSKNEVRVIGANKQSYIYEFEKLLNDDIDQFAVNELGAGKNMDQAEHKMQVGSNNGEQKSPRFGFTSTPIEIQNHKTEPERFSYSHTVKRRKKSTQSATSNHSSDIQDRVNAVIGASRKLISNFRKSKVG